MLGGFFTPTSVILNVLKMAQAKMIKFGKHGWNSVTLRISIELKIKRIPSATRDLLIQSVKSNLEGLFHTIRIDGGEYLLNY